MLEHAFCDAWGQAAALAGKQAEKMMHRQSDISPTVTAQEQADASRGLQLRETIVRAESVNMYALALSGVS